MNTQMSGFFWEGGGEHAQKPKFQWKNNCIWHFARFYFSRLSYLAYGEKIIKLASKNSVKLGEKSTGSDMLQETLFLLTCYIYLECKRQKLLLSSVIELSFLAMGSCRLQRSQSALNVQLRPRLSAHLAGQGWTNQNTAKPTQFVSRERWLTG